MKKISPFHLAIPVRNLEVCRNFYGEILNCSEGRSSEKWVDFNFFGHQLVIHKVQKNDNEKVHSNPVDGHQVPVPHFGVVLDWDDWQKLATDLKVKNIQFLIEPYTRFKGKIGEQATLFLYDPSGNALEFKTFKNRELLFSK